jgi:hypothetical protein
MDWPGGTHALRAEALNGIDLPLSAKLLLEAGLPLEVRVPGWLGPTLFSSEIASDELLTASSFDPAFEEHAFAQALVIGSVREMQGPPSAYAAFCLRPTTGELWLVDVDDSRTARFVNRTLEQFLRSIPVFLKAWTRAQAVPQGDISDIARDLHDALQAIDTDAFANQDNYWPTWLETEFERS